MQAAEEPAAAARAVCKAYPGGIVALDHVDLVFGRGLITALIGSNGSGKTTLLKILAGLLAPTTGAVRVLGVDVAVHPQHLRAHVGYVAQAVELDPEMTGVETLALFATLYGVPRSVQRRRIEKISTTFGLDAHVRRRVAVYSGGLRQRLHLALSLLHDPELLVLDEPTAALDPSGRAFMWELLRRVRDQGRTVVIATHDLLDVERHCDRVAFLHQGRVLAHRSPHELIEAGSAWTLLVSVAGGTVMPTVVEERLSSVDGIGIVRRHQGEWSMDVAAARVERAQAIKDLVLAALADSGVETTGFQLLPPDLSSAYFNLAREPLLEGEPRDGRGAGARGTPEEAAS
jgi:ABC-2 type transport system ATP-binding protein